MLNRSRADCRILVMLLLTLSSLDDSNGNYRQTIEISPNWVTGFVIARCFEEGWKRSVASNNPDKTHLGAS